MMASSGALRCFVVMPFEKPWSDNLYWVIRLSLMDRASVGAWTVTRGDELHGRGTILEEVCKAIDVSDLVVADLGGLNANVVYELAFADQIRKPVVILAPRDMTLPFDVQHRRVVRYDSGRWEAVSRDLRSVVGQLVAEGLWGRPAKFWWLLSDVTSYSLAATMTASSSEGVVRRPRVSWCVAAGWIEVIRRGVVSYDAGLQGASVLDAAMLAIEGGAALESGNHIALGGPIMNKCTAEIDEHLLLPARWRREPASASRFELPLEPGHSLWLLDAASPRWQRPRSFADEGEGACIIARAATAFNTSAVTIEGSHADDTFWGIERSLAEGFWADLARLVPRLDEYLNAPEAGVCLVLERAHTQEAQANDIRALAAYGRLNPSANWVRLLPTDAKNECAQPST